MSFRTAENKTDLRGVSSFLVYSGILRPRETKLLPAETLTKKEIGPVEEKVESGKFGFDADREANYLRGIEPERRRVVLKAEIATSVEEALKFTFTNTYKFENGRIVDSKSGEIVGNVVARGGRDEETKAFETMEKDLAEDGAMVVNISPDNKKFRYPKGVVDIWTRQGSEIRWARVTTENSFGELKDIYKDLGGEEVKSKEELLASPIKVKEMTISEIVKKFKLTEEKNNISSREINQVVESLVDNFVNIFGEKILTDAEKIFRLFSAAMTEVPKWIKDKMDKTAREIKLKWEAVRHYAFAQMGITLSRTFGCDFMTMVGSFGQRVGGFFTGILESVQNFFGEKFFNCPRCKGKIPSGKGIEKCPHCGMTKNEAGSTCD